MPSVIRWAIVALALVGCGGGLPDDAVSNITNSARANAMALTLCAPDAGTCNASQMRALSRMSLCALDSTLATNGEPTVDGGVQCQPR